MICSSIWKYKLKLTHFVTLVQLGFFLSFADLISFKIIKLCCIGLIDLWEQEQKKLRQEEGNALPVVMQIL